jgi:cell division septation protein DedD
MRNNETGEFELIIGNRQLLSGFFIVVLLFAVAFAMGYVVGQNSPKSAKLAAEAPGPASTASGTDRPAPVSAAANPQPQPANPSGETPPPASDTPAQPSTQPVKENDAAPAASPAAQPAQPAAAAPSYPAPPDAPPLSYWQVAAVSQPDVDVFYKTLKDRGFPTYVEPGTKGLIRVLVGPYANREAMGKAKDEIEKLGFHPVRR